MQSLDVDMCVLRRKEPFLNSVNISAIALATLWNPQLQCN